MRYWRPRKLPARPKVAIYVASYLNEDPRRCASLRALVACFQAQTYQNWELFIVHDGPLLSKEGKNSLAWLVQDRRVQLVETASRKQQFGHPWRHWALERYGRDCRFALFTNDDGLYAPVLLEYSLDEALKVDADFVYFDMIHSHQHWKFFSTKPKSGRLDLGGFLVKRELALTVPWQDYSFSGDGVWINALAAKARVKVKVPACLFTHN